MCIIFSCLYNHFLSWKWKGHQQNILTNLYVEDRAAVKHTPQITIFMCTPSYTWGQSCTYNAIYQLEEAAIAFSLAEQGTIWLPNESCNLRLHWNWIQRKKKHFIKVQGNNYVVVTSASMLLQHSNNSRWLLAFVHSSKLFVPNQTSSTLVQPGRHR